MQRIRQEEHASAAHDKPIVPDCQRKDLGWPGHQVLLPRQTILRTEYDPSNPRRDKLVAHKFDFIERPVWTNIIRKPIIAIGRDPNVAQIAYQNKTSEPVSSIP